MPLKDMEKVWEYRVDVAVPTTDVKLIDLCLLAHQRKQAICPLGGILFSQQPHLGPLKSELFCYHQQILTPNVFGGDNETAEDLHCIDSCEYIWEAGVGFAHSPPHSYIHDLNRTELLKLLLTCFSEAVYLPPTSEGNILNPWVQFFCSTEN
eukprot:g36604.t1